MDLTTPPDFDAADDLRTPFDFAAAMAVDPDGFPAPAAGVPESVLGESIAPKHCCHQCAKAFGLLDDLFDLEARERTCSFYRTLGPARVDLCTACYGALRDRYVHDAAATKQQVQGWYRDAGLGNVEAIVGDPARAFVKIRPDDDLHDTAALLNGRPFMSKTGNLIAPNWNDETKIKHHCRGVSEMVKKFHARNARSLVPSIRFAIGLANEVCQPPYPQWCPLLWRAFAEGDDNTVMKTIPPLNIQCAFLVRIAPDKREAVAILVQGALGKAAMCIICDGLRAWKQAKNVWEKRREAIRTGAPALFARQCATLMETVGSYVSDRTAVCWAADSFAGYCALTMPVALGC